MSGTLKVLSNLFRDVVDSRSSFSLAFALAIPPRIRRLGIYPRIVKTVDGLKVYVNDFATLDINIPDQYVRREYELHQDYVPREGWVVLDIGAYVGLYSLRASKLVGLKGFVVAFEPNPYVFQWLKYNLKLNRATNVRALPIALGDRNGFTELYVVTKGNIEPLQLYATM